MNKELLFQLYGIFSPSGSEKKMRKFIKRYVSNLNCKVVQDSLGNLFITKGVSDTYPCLAAHLDQVQRNHSKDFEVIEGKDVCFGYSHKSRAQQGLGADDKNGIFICLECLRKYDILKVAFFVGEETGCVGSSDCDLSFFSDCRYIVQPDRMNGHDLITSMFCGSVCSDDFVKAIGAASYGYKTARGSITDVGTLVERGVGISCLNVSCGYYDAHTDREFTVLSELQNCLDFVCHIVETLTDVYPYEYKDWWDDISYGRYSWVKPTKDGLANNGVSDVDYYDYGYYNDDFDMMDMLLQQHPTLTFEDIVEPGGWLCNFFTRDLKALREIYDDAVALRSEEYWHGEYEDDDVPLADVLNIKKAS